MKPIKFKHQAAQGDCLFIRVRSIPDAFKPVARNEEGVIVAHSETGHHHKIDAAGVVMFDGGDPLRCFLQIDDSFADVVHHRSFDTHATLRLTRGCYEVRRAREWSPEGWRRVED